MFAGRGLGFIVALVVATSAQAEDENFLKGTFTQNQICKGDGSDPKNKLVKITEDEVDSSFGRCKFTKKDFDGKSVSAQIACKGAAGEMLGDVTFTLRDDGAIDFADQDGAYRVVLHKCPEKPR